MAQTHRVVKPAILYFGTPVVLISTENEDGSTNLAPMSSAWWLGQRCILGLASGSQTTINLARTRQCVLNLPADDLVPQVNALARTTGTEEVPPWKLAMGYRFTRHKFGASGLTPQASELVRPPRALECPVQMEAELVATHGLMQDMPDMKDFISVMEVKILRVHAHENIIMGDHPNRIDPDKWRPMIMSFQRFYGITGELQASELAKIDEEMYRKPDPPAAEEECIDDGRQSPPSVR